MRLRDIIHAPTRPAWTVRLVVYIAIMVTVTLIIQVVDSLWL